MRRPLEEKRGERARLSLELVRERKLRTGEADKDGVSPSEERTHFDQPSSPVAHGPRSPRATLATSADQSLSPAPPRVAQEATVLLAFLSRQAQLAGFHRADLSRRRTL